MQFPLSLWDVSLWLATMAIILLITAELISPRYAKTNILINKKRLDRMAFALGILFLLTVFIWILEMI